MKIAIYGTSGFVGSALLSCLLEQGHSLKTINRSLSGGTLLREGCEEVVFDPVRDEISCLTNYLKNVDSLINCAGIVGTPEEMYAAHELLVNSLIDAASLAKVKRIVHLSSVGVYGKPNTSLVDETHLTRPLNAYEVSKLKSEQLLLQAAKNKEIDYVILRPSNVYGNSMSNQSLFQLISTINKGIFFFIGNRFAKMNYVHVKDVAFALSACATHPDARNKIFNISNSCSIADFVKIVCLTLKIRNRHWTMPLSVGYTLAFLSRIYPSFPLSPSRVRAMSGNVTYSSRKIEDELGVKPEISMSVGLAELVEVWKSGGLDKV